MKTIKKEEYKGYRIIIQGRYEEDTKVYQLTDVHYDSVILKLLVTSNHRNYLLNESLVIEKDRDNNEQLYGETNKAIEDLIEKAKKAIDKKVREEEITNGLPESLLPKDAKEDASSDEDEEDYSDLLLNFIYMAMMDLGYSLADIKRGEPKGDKIEDFTKRIADNLKRQNGLT